jgi:hypothetical protein
MRCGIKKASISVDARHPDQLCMIEYLREGGHEFPGSTNVMDETGESLK